MTAPLVRRSRHVGLGRTWVAVALAGLLGTSGHAVSPPAEAAGLVGAQDPAWAPDGKRVAVSVLDTIWTMTPDGAVTPVTSMPGDERWPSWTPDGRLVFAGRATRNGRLSADPGAQWDLYVVREVAGVDLPQTEGGVAPRARPMPVAPTAT